MAQDPREMYNYLRDLGVADDKLYELRRQMERADAIRAQPGPEGNVAGGIYVASNPLEHLAYGIDQYRARKDYQDAQSQVGPTSEQRAAARGGLGMSLHERLMGGGSSVSDPAMAAEMLRNKQHDLAIGRQSWNT